MKTILIGYINHEESLVDITIEYNRIEAQIKSLLNTAPWSMAVEQDFADFKRQQRALLKQRDELFAPKPASELGYRVMIECMFALNECYLSNH